VILREMPDPHDLLHNPPYREQFYRTWGKRNFVIDATARDLEYPPYQQRLSVKMVSGGRETYFVDGRELAVDDDCYLVMNDGATYGSAIPKRSPVNSFSVFFRPRLAEEVLATFITPEDQLLSSPQELPRPVEFSQTLRPHDQRVSPLMRHIKEQVAAGLDDELWLEEQLGVLAKRLLEAHRADLQAVASIPVRKRSTRLELFRRVTLATDFIHAHYKRPLGNEDLARIATMSPFHFIRAFRAVHGTTPYRFLQSKRAGVAARLLERTDLPVTEIAARVGFDDRASLFRCMQMVYGRSPRTIRQRARVD
jgi:AraC family transcriptional regulator